LQAGDFIRIELKHDGDLAFPHGLANFHIFHQRIVPLHNLNLMRSKSTSNVRLLAIDDACWMQGPERIFCCEDLKVLFLFFSLTENEFAFSGHVTAHR